MFSQGNQAVPMKHESQLLFRIHIFFRGFPAFFHDYCDSTDRWALLVI